MKLSIVNLTLGLLAMTAGACTEDAMQDLASTLHGNTTIEAELVETESRTAIDPTTYLGNDVGLLWLPGDTLGVFGSTTSANVPFINDEQTRRLGNSTFSGDLASGEVARYVYYPYSNTAGTDVDNLHGVLPGVQPFNMSTGEIAGDYKIGEVVANNNSASAAKFRFSHIFSLLRVAIDASGSDVEGDRLESIQLSSKGRQLYGNFTFSAKTGEYRFDNADNTQDEIVMKWTERPALTNRSYVGYISCAPTVREGDRLDFVIVTENYQVEFSMDVIIDLEANGVYTVPLNLSVQAAKGAMKIKSRPTMSALSLTAAANPDKILNKEVYINGQNSAVRSNSGIINLEKTESGFYGYIPYLNNRNLVPTFTVAEGVKVYSAETEVISGKTEVDFLNNPELRVVADGAERTYAVKLENTGLPVVVITQSNPGSIEDAKNVNGDVVNHFLDFKVRGKDTKWVKTDHLTFYNSDGSVDTDVLGGVRLRGNSTMSWDKKPFAIKFVEDRSVFGMPSHNRWVLLANRSDRSMLRNNIVMQMARATQSLNGGNGMIWNPRGMNVELVIDGHYVGNYYLCEQIKIGPDRINITEPYDKDTNLSYEQCGYLLELDAGYDENCKFKTSRYSLPVMFKDDVPDTYVTTVSEIFNKVENYLYNKNFTEVRKLVDYNSIIDNWLIHEIAMNDEYKHPKSVYMTLDPAGDGLLHGGCVWDFDWATFPNIENRKALGDKYYDETDYSRFDYAGNLNGNVWIPLLMRDATFQARVQQRWNEIYSRLSVEIPAYIRNQGQLNSRSFAQNDAMWRAGFTDQLKNGDEGYSNYTEITENLVNCFNKRMASLDALIKAGSFPTR